MHHCDECGYATDRDVAAAIVVEQRGAECTAFLPEVTSGSFFGSLTAVGQIVKLPVEEGCLGTLVKQESLKSDFGKPALSG